MQKKTVISALALALLSTGALAADKGDFTVNGFGTVGVSKMGGEDKGRSYGSTSQVTDSWRGDSISRFGVQATYGLSDSVSATLQVTAKASGDSWEVNPEWAYLSWDATDNLMVRAGRLRNPIYMYSETLDVSFTYPWLTLPEEVYGQVQLSNYEGADIVYTRQTDLGQLSTQVYAGQAKDRDYLTMDMRADMDYDKIFGLSAALQTDKYGTFRLTYSEADITTEISGFVDRPAFMGGPGVMTFATFDEQKGKFMGVGHRYDNGTWITSAEFSSLKIEADGKLEENGYYAMGGRRFGDYLVHLTHGGLRAGSVSQKSWTLGLNYSIAPSVTVKGEYKHVNTHGGAEGLFVRDLQAQFDNGLYEAGLGGTQAKNHSADIFSVGVDFVF